MHRTQPPLPWREARDAYRTQLLAAATPQERVRRAAAERDAAWRAHIADPLDGEAFHLCQAAEARFQRVLAEARAAGELSNLVALDRRPVTTPAPRRRWTLASFRRSRLWDVTLLMLVVAVVALVMAAVVLVKDGVIVL